MTIEMMAKLTSVQVFHIRIVTFLVSDSNSQPKKYNGASAHEAVLIRSNKSDKWTSVDMNIFHQSDAHVYSVTCEDSAIARHDIDQKITCVL